jgi:hypothetical protein
MDFERPGVCCGVLLMPHVMKYRYIQSIRRRLPSILYCQRLYSELALTGSMPPADHAAYASSWKEVVHYPADRSDATIEDGQLPL